MTNGPSSCRANDRGRSFEHFSEVVAAGSEVEWPGERPGPGGWTILVNGRAATDSDDWPGDNPALEFTIVIDGDGAVSVEHT